MPVIITHLPPRHMDDFLALVVLREVFPLAEIRYIHPQSSELSVWKNDKNYILVDVGEDYDPEMNNYDHHHDKNLPCSFILIVKHFLSDEEKELILLHPAVHVIDAIDNFGFETAKQVYGLKPDKEVDKKRKTILLVDLEKYNIFPFFIEALKNTSNYDEFILYFYDCLDRARILEEPKRLIEEEEQKINKLLSKARVMDYKGIKVLYSQESFSPYHSQVFSETKADIIIERNKMNASHTSVIKNSSSPFYDRVDLNQLSQLYRQVFIHKTGFITVLDVPVENVDVVLILEKILSNI